MAELLTVVHEDAELLVVHKPAGLVCHPTKGDACSSLIGRLRLYLGFAGAPQLVNRLDRETSGLVLVAKTREAARDLRRLWETRAVTKKYLAIVHGVPSAPAGVVDTPLGPDPASPVAIKDCVRPDGAPARTAWRWLRAWGAGFARGAAPKASSACSKSNPAPAANTKSASTSPTSAIPSWAIKSTVATRGCTWTSSSAA